MTSLGGGLTGCDFVATALNSRPQGDGLPAEQPAPVRDAGPLAVAPAQPLPAPPPLPVRTPEEILAAFVALPSSQRTDGPLVEVCALDVARSTIADLDLTGAQLTAAGIAALWQLPLLKSLNLTDTPVKSAELVTLPELKSLESLILDGTRLDDAGLGHVARIAALRRLSLGGVPVSDAALGQLGSLAQLESLRLTHNRDWVGGAFGKMLQDPGLPRLRELTVIDTRLGVAGLNNLDLLPNLEIFRCDWSNLENAAMPALGRCEKLRVLELTHCQLNDLGLTPLLGRRGIEELNLLGSGSITDNGLNVISKLGGLKKLDLTDTACTLPAVQLLATRYLKNAEIKFGEQTW